MNDDYATPLWLKKFFEGWYDPCPLNPTFDGLNVPWEDWTFANVPYSDPASWIDKAIAEKERGIEGIVLLVRVDTSTRWWTRLLESGARIACFQGRISFDGGKRPYFASALVFL